MAKTITPMMQQYQDAKLACPDAILLFRMGDFYELFHDDAKVAAKTLNLALTSRDKGENPIPMAGFPHHQLDSYLAKLISSGLRVAVCDQVEDPKQAKGLVRREVTRVVSPGTVTDDALYFDSNRGLLILAELIARTDMNGHDRSLQFFHAPSSLSSSAQIVRTHSRICKDSCQRSDSSFCSPSVIA